MSAADDRGLIRERAARRDRLISSSRPGLRAQGPARDKHKRSTKPLSYSESLARHTGVDTGSAVLPAQSQALYRRRPVHVWR